MADFEFLADALADLDRRGLARSVRTVTRIDGPRVWLADRPGPVVLMCSNDYLGLAGDPRIAQAVAQAMADWGYGAGASRLICGTTELHRRLEQRFARWLGKEAALLFSSGFAANEALLRTLPEPGDRILLDRMDHASIIDGVTAGQARFKRYGHLETDRLERLLAEPRWRRRYIVTETVFSMDGDTPDLHRLVALKHRYDAILILDEAHAIGCLGPTGAGLAETDGVLDRVDIIVAPLGKALAASGAVVAGPQSVIDTLVNRARAFIYTTACPPAHCAAVMAAMDIIRDEPQRRRRLADNARRLRRRLAELAVCTIAGTTHIVPILLGDSDRAVRVSQTLLDRGYLAVAIRPPTFPAGTARLRVSVRADHTDEHIDEFCDALAQVLATE